MPLFGKFSEKSLSLHSHQMVLNIDLKEEEVRKEARMRGARGSSREETARQTDSVVGKRLEQQGSLAAGDQAKDPAPSSLQKKMRSENKRSGRKSRDRFEIRESAIPGQPPSSHTRRELLRA